MVIWPLPRIVFRELNLVEETRPVALVTTPAAWDALSARLALPVLIQAEPARSDRALIDYLADNLPARVKVIYAVGQGAPVMAAKVIAARRGVPLVIVPTALDSDWMLTPLTRFEDQGEDQTRIVWEATGPATEIVIDWDVIRAAPADVRGAGIVDVLSIVTGLLDWRFAAQQGKNPREQRFESWAAAMAAALAKEAIKIAAAVGQGDLGALQTLLNLMVSAVQLSNQLGHTRAQYGAEHVLAQMIAGQIGDTRSHASIVGPCLLLVSALHGQAPAALRTALEQAHVPLNRLRPTDVQLALNNLPTLLADYEPPYTILDTIDPLSPQVTEALEQAGLAIRDATWELTDSQRLVAIELGEAIPPVEQVQAGQAAPATIEFEPPEPEHAIPEQATAQAPVADGAAPWDPAPWDAAPVHDDDPPGRAVAPGYAEPHGDSASDAEAWPGSAGV